MLKRTVSEGNQRLLNVARALRESPNPEKFDMGRYGDDDCGTPACAFGHYAARQDLQDRFALVRRELRVSYAEAIYFSTDVLLRYTGEMAFYDSHLVLEHFGISWEEADDLFSVEGCGGANTPAQAADFIEAFVAKRMAEELVL